MVPSLEMRVIPGAMENGEIRQAALNVILCEIARFELERMDRCGCFLDVAKSARTLHSLYTPVLFEIEKASDRRDPWIVGELEDFGLVRLFVTARRDEPRDVLLMKLLVHVRVHRPKLENLERFHPLADAYLFEQYRPTGPQLHERGNDLLYVIDRHAFHECAAQFARPLVERVAAPELIARREAAAIVPAVMSVG